MGTIYMWACKTKSQHLVLFLDSCNGRKRGIQTRTKGARTVLVQIPSRLSPSKKSWATRFSFFARVTTNHIPARVHPGTSALICGRREVKRMSLLCLRFMTAWLCGLGGPAAADLRPLWQDVDFFWHCYLLNSCFPAHISWPG